ncbi:unnamed protein product, partial [Eretmochelys imbricata]
QVRISSDLTPIQKIEAADMINRNRDVFSTKPGQTTETYHHIHTIPGAKVTLRPYRIPAAKREEIKAEVKKMLELGVIEESYSQWSSPIVLVPKPDGTMRFCNDFRQLNEISQFDAHPILRIDELVDRLGSAQFLTTLDLTKGYWQIPLTKEAKEKTVFSTPDGLFHYTVLPFGLHGAPATFQHLMDKLLCPHTSYAAAYLDDVVIIHTPDWGTHLEKVEAVLRTLRRACLTANPAKCTIGLAEARYLGYIVGRGIVKPQMNKLEAIQNWPWLTLKKQVCAFLGVVGYYRCFIPHFATSASPLTDLVKARGPDMVKWTDAAVRAFTALWTALCNNPVLIAPDFNREFILQTDASEVVVGTVLSQMVGEEEHPILYLSRKLLPREQKYAVVERECLAVKWAMEALRYYLLGRRFTLVMDHAPLQWMQRNKEKNGNIDGLSRAYCLASHVAQLYGWL